MKKVEIVAEESLSFSFIEPKEGNELFHIDLPENLYAEYLSMIYRYNQFQIKLQVLYEFSKFGKHLPKGAKIYRCTDPFSGIVFNASKEQLSAFFFKGYE